MADQLDSEALAFMQQRNPNFSQTRPLSYTPNAFGGKARTKVPQRETMKRRGGTYISDDPDRFIQYTDDFKDELVTPEQAKDLIISKWQDDASLRNLINGIYERHGAAALDRELTSLVNARGLQPRFDFAKVAQRLGYSPKQPRRFERFKRYILPFLVQNRLSEAAERIERDRYYKPQLSELTRQTQTGSVRGQATEGRVTTFKIGRGTIVRYRDAKGRFIKIG